MLRGILQRLKIIQQTESQLVLREMPLLDYGIAFILIIAGLIVAVVQFWISAVIAVSLAFYFIIQGRIRLLTFDATAGLMTVHYQTLLKKETVNQIALADIQDVSLYQGEDGGTQIILIQVDGEETGISAYSADMTPWKEDLIQAIKAILRETR